MHAELAAEQTTSGEGMGMAIAVAGINGIGQQIGFAALTPGDSLPWVQDTTEFAVWSAWRRSADEPIVYRDVVVLDGANRVAAVYNLTDHSLALPANYEALKAILRTAAGR